MMPHVACKNCTAQLNTIASCFRIETCRTFAGNATSALALIQSPYHPFPTTPVASCPFSSSRVFSLHCASLAIAFACTNSPHHCAYSICYTMSDDNRLISTTNDNRLVSTRTSNLPTLLNTSGGLSIFPANFNFSAEIASGTFYGQPDGSFQITFNAHPNKAQCEFCYEEIHDQKQVHEHHQRFTRPCKVCHNNKVWCQMGLAAYELIPYCTYTCVEHGKCFDTGDAARDHGLNEQNTRCFYPRCRNQLATSAWDAWYIYHHVKDDHCNGATGA